MGLEVRVREKRIQGWLTGAALYGVFGCLVPYIAATPLGWLGALAGTVPALLIKAKRLPPVMNAVRGVWGLGAVVLSVGECARGIVDYTYPEWSAWVPAALLLAVGWRGSALDEKGQERCGKLLVWLMLAMTAVLVALVLPRLDLRFEKPRGWSDVWEGVRVALITFGCVSVVTPVQGRLVGGITTLSGAAAGGVSVSALGPALAGMVRYPFLVLCDAAVFELRLSSLGTAMWALSESALVILLLSRLPRGKWVKFGCCLLAFGLGFTLPWPNTLVVAYLFVGAVLGYILYFVEGKED